MKNNPIYKVVQAALTIWVLNSHLIVKRSIVIPGSFGTSSLSHNTKAKVVLHVQQIVKQNEHG